MQSPQKATAKKLGVKEKSINEEQCSSCKELGPKPSEAPDGEKWVKAWLLVDKATAAASSSTSSSHPRVLRS